jgi:hypothetical protein
MSPDSSASGMNSSGGTIPRRAWFQRESRQRAGVQLALEDLVAVLPGLLRHVHGHVRVAEQLIGSAPRVGELVGHSDADARADEDLLALEVERSLERREDPHGDVGRAKSLTAVLEEDRELVASEPCRRVRSPQGVLHPFAHFRQHEVSGLMSEGVVDRLEVVQVHQ